MPLLSNTLGPKLSNVTHTAKFDSYTALDIMDVLLWNLDSTWSNIAASLAATNDDLSSIEDITGALIDEKADVVVLIRTTTSIGQWLPRTANTKNFPHPQPAVGNALDAKKKGI
jgi:hypothetical protein